MCRREVEKSFYSAILGTGVWNPTLGRTGDERGWGEEDEVSLATVPWENHPTEGGDQVESLEPFTNPSDRSRDKVM